MRHDWTNQRFGHLVALSDTGKRHHRSAVWLFQCDCGRTCEKPTAYIRDSIQSGYDPRCGECRRDDFDIAGDIYGKLTAIRELPKNGDSGRPGALWEFRCECGEIVRRIARDVRMQARDGYTPNCGKAECNNGFKYRSRYLDGESARNELIHSYRKGAMKRNLAFELTTEELEHLFQGDCYYCGIEPRQVRKSHSRTHSSSYVYNGIDRIDNNLGYIPGNVVACCENCNKAKRQMSHDEFLALVFRIARRHEG